MGIAPEILRHLRIDRSQLVRTCEEVAGDINVVRMSEVALLVCNEVISFHLADTLEHYRFGKILRHGRSSAVDAAESVFLGIFVKYG